MTSWPVSAGHSSSAIWSFSLLPDVATSATALRIRSGSAKCCGYAASRAGRAIQNPILPNIRLASLEAGTLRQVLAQGHSIRPPTLPPRDPGLAAAVESARGAVPGLLPARF